MLPDFCCLERCFSWAFWQGLTVLAMAIALSLFEVLMPCCRERGGGVLRIQPAPGIQSPPVVSRPVFSEADLGLRFAFMRR